MSFREHHNEHLDRVWAFIVFTLYLCLMFGATLTIFHYWPLFVKLFSLFLVLLGILILVAIVLYLTRYAARTKAMAEYYSVPFQIAKKTTTTISTPVKNDDWQKPKDLSFTRHWGEPQTSESFEDVYGYDNDYED